MNEQELEKELMEADLVDAEFDDSGYITVEQQEILRLRAELKATKHLLNISEEVNAGYEKDCSVGFALQRDEAKQQLIERNKVILEAFEIMKIAEKRSKSRLPFEDELNEVLDVLSDGTYFKIKEQNE